MPLTESRPPSLSAHQPVLIAISNDFNLTGVKLHISCIIHSLLAQRHIISEILTSGKINRIVLNKLLNINVQRENHVLFSEHILFYIYIHLYLYRRVCVCLCVYPSKHIHVAVCGPIGTKFDTHMQIHLEKVVGKIKICPV